MPNSPTTPIQSPQEDPSQGNVTPLAVLTRIQDLLKSTDEKYQEMLETLEKYPQIYWTADYTSFFTTKVENATTDLNTVTMAISTTHYKALLTKEQITEIREAIQDITKKEQEIMKRILPSQNIEENPRALQDRVTAYINALAQSIDAQYQTIVEICDTSPFSEHRKHS